MKRQKKVHIIGWPMGLVWLGRRGLGFMKKGGHFCLIKTYVLGLNLGDLMNSL